MALHGCLRILKYIVFSTNFIVWITGMLMLGLAIYLRTDPDTNQYIQAAYQDKIFTFYTLCYIMVGCGVLVTFVGFLGCCGAFHESKCMLAAFFVFLLLIFLAEIGCGVTAFFLRNQVLQSTVTATFTEYVKHTYGKDEHFDEPVDLVQKNFECCGGSGPSDWNNSYWILDDQHRIRKVPDTCCKNTRIPRKFSSGVCGVSGAWIDDQHPGVHSKGCGSELVMYFKEHLWLIWLISLGIISVQLVGLFFSLVLCIGMRKQHYGGYKS